jgi:thiol-disulfide isomerase/thioredoxin
MSSESGLAKTWGVTALAAVAGFAAIYLTMGRSDNAPVTNSAPVQQAAAAPDVGAPANATLKLSKLAAFVTKKQPEPLPDITFNDSSGGERKLSDFKGRTILLNLWATWCAPCREEMPALNRLQEQLGSDTFEVVALSLDRQGAAASQKFLDEVNAKALKLYVDATAKQGVALKIVGMPTTILINADGLEVGRLAGPAEWDSDEAKQLIAAAMP